MACGGRGRHRNSRCGRGKEAQLKRVYVVGTADTKGEELSYLADLVAARGLPVTRVDISTGRDSVGAQITPAEIAAFHPGGREAVLGLADRGTAVAAMGEAFRRFVLSRDDLGAIVGIGGGGGTSIITAGMRGLPYGIPKLMVSTMASGDVSAYVDVSDIIMMPSVTDMAGLNGLSRVILHNAAQAIAGMAAVPGERQSGKPSLGLTMFGVTTPCVMAIAERLRTGYDCMVFHATGAGGRTMEKLADSGMLAGVIDITTTEVCDLLFGGVLPATDDRFGAIARTRIPYVGSAGALDMVNFHAFDTVPQHLRGRNLYRHNPNVTLMRTSAEECRALGEWIGAKLNACDGEVRFLIPEKGVSALDIAGGPFFDPGADNALFAAIDGTVRQTASRRVVRLPLHINDPAFAEAAASTFLELTGR
jgi:uncharacterized protein (UPF0261 family)